MADIIVNMHLCLKKSYKNGECQLSKETFWVGWEVGPMVSMMCHTSRVAREYFLEHGGKVRLNFKVSWYPSPATTVELAFYLPSEI